MTQDIIKNRKYSVGVIGATGYVGQHFVSLLSDHPWFEIKHLYASERSRGMTYQQAIAGREKTNQVFKPEIAELQLMSLAELETAASDLDFVFCAVSMAKEEVCALEEKIARLELPVVSNNSAHRGTPDVPMIIPELNWQHAEIINAQKKRLGTSRGFIAVKPNCSIQSYVPAIHPLLSYEPNRINVVTAQAVSGAGRSLADWPEMDANVIPYIGGEEEKSEQEPLKIWGSIAGEVIRPAINPIISAQCLRVPVEHGHLAAVSVAFKQRISKEEILSAWENFKIPDQVRELPSAVEKFLNYWHETDRPQSKLDAGAERGMQINIGRLREDNIFDYKFICLSHNIMRGAAGGAVLMAEQLCHQGWIEQR
ncbi:MAG TPA: aspartate-semialdehyde dehydrogenase [Clostridiaceae bacterium]|nr:aspartate-semialdehyde dehydrogenase [Clostridiaceae bacterium]